MRCAGGWEGQQLLLYWGDGWQHWHKQGEQSETATALFVLQKHTQFMSRTHPFIYCPFLWPCWDLQRCLKGQPEVNTAAASAEQRVCAGPWPLCTGTEMMGAGPRSWIVHPLFSSQTMCLGLHHPYRSSRRQTTLSCSLPYCLLSHGY